MSDYERVFKAAAAVLGGFFILVGIALGVGVSLLVRML